MNTIAPIKLNEKCYWHPDSQTLTDDGNIIDLTPNMTKLLALLIQNLDRPVSSIDIFFHIWEDLSGEFNPKNIRNLVSNLRKRVPQITIANYYGGRYLLKKYRNNLPDISEYVIEILDQAKNGVILTDPNLDDNPIIFVNEAFSEMFGYSMDEVYGKNCRFLHGSDKDQKALSKIRNTLLMETDITITIRNYTKSGELIYNELSITPIFDKKTQKLKFFLGIQKNVTTVQNLIQQIKQMVNP